MKTRILCLVILLTSSVYSISNTPTYEREYSLKNSTNAVIAIKIDGRIGCNALNSFPKVSRDEKCFGSNITEDMALYNLQKRTEDFLIIRSLKGSEKQGDIIKVAFQHQTEDFGHMDVGSAYLIFFHQEADGFHYEYCDVVQYEQVEKLLEKKLSFDQLVNVLLAKDLSICPSFYPTTNLGSKSAKSGVRVDIE
jgi:hypothetical protein